MFSKKHGKLPYLADMHMIEETIAQKWSLEIINYLMNNPEGATFSTIKQELVINSRTLTQRLDMLEQLAVIERQKCTTTTPICTVYVLTEKGQALRPVFMELKRWINTHG